MLALHATLESRVERWLMDHDVPFELIEHRPVYEPRARARAVGAVQRCVARTVIAETADGRRALVVVGAGHRPSPAKVARALDTRSVRFIPDVTQRRELPQPVPHAFAPIPELYRLPLLADYAIRDDPILWFAPERTDATVRVERAAWEHAVGPRYADIAAGVGTRSVFRQEIEPAAWSRLLADAADLTPRSG